MNIPLALVIEDDHDLSHIYSQALRSAGFAAETVDAAADAVTWLSTATPQVVTLDLHLQQTRGDDILNYIRAEPRLAEANVILTTADAALADELRDQADYVLIKPISFTQLRDLALRLKTLC